MSWRDDRAPGSAARGTPWRWEWTPERERRQSKRARQGRVRHHSEWECKQCGKCNFMDRTSCRLCARQRQEDDVVIAGESDEILPGTQPAPKRAPTHSERTTSASGTGDFSALRKAEAALTAAQEADLPQSFIDELAQEVQSRRKEREQQKPIGARLDSASAATKRAKAAWEKARTKYQEAEAGVAAAADVLVNALQTERALREQARSECTKEDTENANRMTAAELHEVLRNVIDSVEKAWPPGAQAAAGLQEAVSVARATLQQTATKTSNSTHEKPQQTHKAIKKQKRRRIESLNTDEGSIRDIKDDSDGFTTSEDEEMMEKSTCIKTNKPAELASMSGEDFERHLLGTQ